MNTVSSSFITRAEKELLKGELDSDNISSKPNSTKGKMK